jgi:deazaflavin-dependent oxidoreductase (nitroreductase family)
MRGWAVRAIVRIHVLVYRLTRGRVGGSWSGAPILLLTTTGRRSGKTKTTPLLYLEDEGNLVVVATNDGAPRHPSWYLNLETNRRARTQIRGSSFEVEARTVEGEERAELWPRLAEMYANYERDQRRAGRELPVVALKRLLAAEERVQG